MRITRKLGLLVAVPLMAVVAFAALAVATTGGEAVRAEDLRRLVVTGAAAGELAHHLQAERAAAMIVLTGGSADAVNGYVNRVAAADQAVGQYQRTQTDLSSLPAGAAGLLERVAGQLSRLRALREQVTAGRGAASAVAFTYRIVIADLISFRESVAQGAPADVADRLRAAAALSQAAEQVGLQQVAVLRAMAFGPLTPKAEQEVTAARAGHIEALLAFDGRATPSWRAALDQSATGPEALVAQRFEDRVARTRVGQTLQLDQNEWLTSLGLRMERLREVEAGVDTEILAEVTALRDAQRRLTGGQIAAVLLAVVAAVGLAALLGRPVLRGLRGLRDAARRVAHHELPTAVARLDDYEVLGGLSPEVFADQVPPPVAVRGKDELAEVGEAFNAVSREAIRTAAEQARLRWNIAKIMLNLARRGQKLTGRLTAALDDVERDELDPRRLAQLYQLDLMATLLGRTNESLLVLGGAGAAQVRTDDQPMTDVLRGALGQVEQYTRIETGVVDDGVAVRAAVVDDVVKLLAELLDNACRYSSPQEPVRVDARLLGDRVIVQVADEGIGLDPARREVLNRRLATRPRLDLEAVETMGMTVVGYLAARHGIRVELRAGQPRGTIAEVTLPGALVTVYPGQHLPARLPRPRTPTPIAPQRPAAPLFQATAPPDLPWPPGPGAPAAIGAPVAGAPPVPAVPGRPGPPVSPLPGARVPAAGGAGMAPPGASEPAASGAGVSPPVSGGAGVSPPRAAVPAPGAVPPSPARGGDGEHTVELRLPIFEQVQESLWFTPRAELRATRPTVPAPRVAEAPAATTPPRVVEAPAATTPEPEGTESTWRTPADDGWRAAARAATPEPVGITRSGLPVRRPGAQLVPGGVDPHPESPPTNAGSEDWRDPLAVGAVAAAYSRGLATGRARYATLAQTQAAEQ